MFIVKFLKRKHPKTIKSNQITPIREKFTKQLSIKTEFSDFTGENKVLPKITNMKHKLPKQSDRQNRFKLPV